MSVTVEYQCADGTPFPVVFDTEEAAAAEWRLDREHVPEAQSPLAEAIGGRLGPGGRRAYEENGMPPFQWEAGPKANGFLYFGTAPPDPADMAARFEAGARLLEQYASTMAVWQERCLPRARESCRALEMAGPGATFEELADPFEYALHQTMVAGMLSSNDRRLLYESVVDALGSEDGADAVSDALWHGYESPTLDADMLLWRGEVAEFMERYGGQATAWSPDAPTLREAPEIVDAQLQLLQRPEAEDPQRAIDRAAERRRKLVAEVDARLAGDEGRRARFRRRVERAATILWVREDRALWQLIAVGALRHAFLRRGAALAADGVIRRAEDALFLEPAEYDSGGGDFREVVERRRADHDRWRGVTPPELIGGESPTKVSAGPVLKGVAAAPGVVQGRARLIIDLADAARLDARDVLVCVMTSPPWTPLLALASALVTDAGDAMSHAAIAAREYGIPCVVGTNAATATIPDGASVIVDGDAGTVEVAR